MTASRASDVRFEFGKNWQSYLRNHLSDERVERAREHLLEFIGRDDLSGLRMLDIGSGSGIHSLAAIRAAAEEVVSFDYDPDSVAATEYLRAAEPDRDRWRVMQGSVLDRAFIESLGQFELVYSWGVLHHTGDLWHAIDSAMTAVAPGGLLYVALYDSDWSKEDPAYWLNIKQRYVKSGFLRRRLAELDYVRTQFLANDPRRLPDLFRRVAAYKKNRGMDFYHDIKDWLGGWPMEYCRIYEVLPRILAQGFQLLRCRTGEANTEYVFARGPVDSAMTGLKPIELPQPVEWTVTSLRKMEDFAALRADQPIYVYGAGRGGEIVAKAVQKQLGRWPNGFITTKERASCLPLSTGEIVDVPVRTLQDYAALHTSQAQVLIASAAFDDISFSLWRSGINQFANAYPFVLASL